jgi:glucan phosphoethanolaminetransferase (alkaline phosphatase superfamily)
MVNWVLWIVVGIAIFLFFKYSNVRYERIWTYVLGVMFIFLLFTFFSVVNHNDVDLTNFDGFVSGMKIYGNWLFGWSKNIATVTGNVVNVDWNGNISEVGSKVAK